MKPANKIGICVLYLIILGVLPGMTLEAHALLASRSDFPVGGCPRSVATGDFNGDGYKDIVTTNVCDGTVSILISDGAGSFHPKSDFSAGTEPTAIAAGDFNGDGKQDLVVTDYRVDSVSSWLGDGTGAFVFNSAFSAGLGPVPVAIGEFNGDGKQDLAVGNNDYNPQFVFYVSVLFGDGTGAFDSKNDLWAGQCAQPTSVAVGDFNKDSKSDIAVTQGCGDTVAIWLGDGAGNFGSKTDFTVGKTPKSVATGDFNRDGKLDLSTANSVSNTVSVLLGDGAGGFGPKTDFAVGDYPNSVATGDINRDGKLDLVTANTGADTISVLLGDGAGGFGPKTDFATGTTPESVAIADFNGDGKPDIAVANGNSSSVSVFFNNTAAADFKAGSTVGPPPFSVKFTDLSSGIITSWSWNFGDGSTSSEQNPTHIYTTYGTYTVSLTVTGPEGSNTKTITNFINVKKVAMPWLLLLLGSE